MGIFRRVVSSSIYSSILHVSPGPDGLPMEDHGRKATITLNSGFTLLSVSMAKFNQQYVHPCPPKKEKTIRHVRVKVAFYREENPRHSQNQREKQVYQGLHLQLANLASVDKEQTCAIRNHRTISHVLVNLSRYWDHFGHSDSNIFQLHRSSAARSNPNMRALFQI